MAKIGERLAVNGKRSDGLVTKTEFLTLSQQGDTLLQQGRAQQAEQLFQGLLARLEAGAAYDDPVELGYDIATTQVRIGRCLAGQGRPLQAIVYQQKAIAGFESLIRRTFPGLSIAPDSDGSRGRRFDRGHAR
jgi:hypothetical protein